MIVWFKLSECKNQHFFALIRYLVLIILLFPFKLEGQYRFDFEFDSSGAEQCALGEGWSQVPGQRWCKDTIHPIAGGSSLHHSFDSSQEGCDHLVFRPDPLNIQDSFALSFRIRHGYLPSSMNNWQLAMGATFENAPDQGGGEALLTSGLVLGVNFSGSDDLIKIWHVDQGVSRVLCTSALNYQEQAGTEKAPLISLRGDGNGKLDLYWSADPDEQLPELLVSCRIDGISWGRQLVLRYQYTSSRDRALWLDDLVLEGCFEKDTLAPRVRELKVLDAHTLELVFSEEVVLSDQFGLFLYSEEFPGGIPPADLRMLGEGLQISFAEMIPNREACRLFIDGVEDLDGNRMEATKLDVMRNVPEWGDVVFNEIMADPEPAIRQTEEYLELYNRSGYPVDPEGWQLHVNERTYVLDASMGIISTENFILLTGITLPNAGGLLSLYSTAGVLIHAACYRPPWDGPAWKKEGGWSLESPDADQPCGISYHWEYSIDPGGGTPGWANSNLSKLEDRETPVFLYAGQGDAGELYLHFSEPIAHFQGTINLSPGDMQPDSLRLVDPLRDILYLHFPEDFREWPQYRLDLPGFLDCAGNCSGEELLQAGKPLEPGPGSVLINEIMYDPEENKPEYVELFLPGPDILDLRDLAIHLVDEGGLPDHPLPLSQHSRLVLPGQYLVLTECVLQLEETYGLAVSGRWVELSGLSGLSSTGGRIYLTDRAGRVVDMADYSDNMHMDLLEDPGGISLERISAERPGDDPGNWHSAASIAGYATPGSLNSQALELSDGGEILEVSPEVFSPDNDGFEDLLDITIRTGGPDWIIGLIITDMEGRLIRVLANNHLAGPSVSYCWDGQGGDGSMQAMGFYAIHVRAYHPATGKQWVRRKAVGLVHR
jgi:hypothetical protein